METKKEDQVQIQYAIFNKHNGLLFAYETDKQVAEGYNKDHFLVKEITLRPYQYYYGDYYNGKVYSEDEVPLIREDEMEENFFREILSEYSVIKQILLIVGVLEQNKELIKSEPFNRYANYLKMKKLRYDESLKSIKENKECFNFVSLEEIEDLMTRRMEGIT